MHSVRPLSALLVLAVMHCITAIPASAQDTVTVRVAPGYQATLHASEMALAQYLTLDADVIVPAWMVVNVAQSERDNPSMWLVAGVGGRFPISSGRQDYLDLRIGARTAHAAALRLEYGAAFSLAVSNVRYPLGALVGGFLRLDLTVAPWCAVRIPVDVLIAVAGYDHMETRVGVQVAFALPTLD